MSYVSHHPVRFAHVDAAGIVFYPRYFEMVNAAVEDFFAQRIGVSFAAMHMDLRLGVPTVKLDAEFVAPSRLGDVLAIAIHVDRVGRTSATLRIEAHCEGALRLRVTVVLVCMDLAGGRAASWPDAMRPSPDAA